MINEAGMNMRDAIETSPIHKALYFRGPRIAIVSIPPTLNKWSFFGSVSIADIQTHGLFPAIDYEKFHQQDAMMLALQQVGIATHYGWVPIHEEMT